MGRFRDSIHDVILGERISDNIYIDSNGQLICENVILARTGYYDYREDELIEGGSPDKVVQVWRSPEEVFDPESIKSMNYKPFVDEHPEDNVTPETVRELARGFMTNVRRGTGEFSNCLMADLVVTDPDVIELIRSGAKRELSVGYTADIEEENGRYVMKHIRGNHIALCEAGRAGNARIRDSKTVRDYEAKGSFNSLEDLKKYYAGAEIDTQRDKVIVNLREGARLLYHYLTSGNGKLFFVRRLSDAKSVVVLGDSVKLREGQRVNYYNTPCKISKIYPVGSNYLIELSLETSGDFVSRLSYGDIVDLINKGRVKLLDSVVFNKDSGEFEFEEIKEDCDKGSAGTLASEIAHSDSRIADSKVYFKILRSTVSTTEIQNYVSKYGAKVLTNAGNGLGLIECDSSNADKVGRLLYNIDVDYTKVNNTSDSIESNSASAYETAKEIAKTDSRIKDDGIKYLGFEIVPFVSGSKTKYLVNDFGESFDTVDEARKCIREHLNMHDSNNPIVKNAERELKNIGLKLTKEGTGLFGSVGQIYETTRAFNVEEFKRLMHLVDRVLNKYRDVTYNGGLRSDGIVSLTVSYHEIKDARTKGTIARDSSETLKPFRVSVNGRKFDTLATSFADAVRKVNQHLSDSKGKEQIINEVAGWLSTELCKTDRFANEDVEEVKKRIAYTLRKKEYETVKKMLSKFAGSSIYIDLVDLLSAVKDSKIKDEESEVGEGVEFAPKEFQLRGFIGDLIDDEVEAIKGYDQTLLRADIDETTRKTLEEIRNDELDHVDKLNAVYKELTSDYTINYRNSYTGERENDSKVKDSIALDIVSEIKKYFPNVQISTRVRKFNSSEGIIKEWSIDINNAKELGKGFEKFIQNLKNKYRSSNKAQINIGTNGLYIIAMADSSIKDSSDEAATTKDSKTVKDDKWVGYLFPVLNRKDLEYAKQYNLKPDKNPRGGAGTYLTGYLSNLKKFARDYLDYILVPEYLDDSNGVKDSFDLGKYTNDPETTLTSMGNSERVDLSESDEKNTLLIRALKSAGFKQVNSYLFIKN